MGSYKISKVDAHLQIWAWRKDYIDGVIASQRGGKGTYGTDTGLFLSVVENTGAYSFNHGVLTGLSIPSGSVPITVVSENTALENINVSIPMTEIHAWVNNVATGYGDAYGIDDTYRTYKINNIDYLIPNMGTNELTVPIRIRYVYKVEFYHTDTANILKYGTFPHDSAYEVVLNCGGNYKLVEGEKPYLSPTLIAYDSNGEVFANNTVTSVPYYLKLVTAISGTPSQPSPGILPVLYSQVSGAPAEVEVEEMEEADYQNDETAIGIGAEYGWQVVDKDNNEIQYASADDIINPYNAWRTERIYKITDLTNGNVSRTFTAKMTDNALLYPIIEANGDLLTLVLGQSVTLPYVTSAGVDHFITISETANPVTPYVVHNPAGNAMTDVTIFKDYKDIYWKNAAGAWTYLGWHGTSQNLSDIAPGGQSTHSESIAVTSFNANAVAAIYKVEVYVSYVMSGVSGAQETAKVTRNMMRKLVSGNSPSISIDTVVPNFNASNWISTTISQSIAIGDAASTAPWNALASYTCLYYSSNAITATQQGNANSPINPTSAFTDLSSGSITIDGTVVTITQTVANQSTGVHVPSLGGASLSVTAILTACGGGSIQKTTDNVPPPPSQPIVMGVVPDNVEPDNVSESTISIVF